LLILLIYIKQINTLLKAEGFDKWSFGIITNGEKKSKFKI